jgi:uncharacterized protein YjiS (DUF1127 family)
LTNLTAERDAASRGLGHPIAAATNVAHGVLAAARPDAPIATLRDALSDKEAAAPPGAPMSSLFSLLAQCWLAFRAGQRRRRLRVDLRDLSERQLMDIGLQQGDIDHIAAHRAVERFRDNMSYQLMSRGVM